MLTEQDRLKWKVNEMDRVIQERNRTIQEQQKRLARQTRRIRNLLWDCLALVVALIIVGAVALKAGCW